MRNDYLLFIIFDLIKLKINGMFKNTTFLIALLVSINAINAQKTVIQNNPNYKYQSGNETTTQTAVKRTIPVFNPYWSFGGNVGLSFWNGGTDLMIAPKAYYHLTPQFITGIGVTYMYSDGEYYGINIGAPNRYYNYHSNSFGGSVSALYRPIPYLQFSAEYEGLQTEWRGKYEDSYFNNAIYLGASFITGPFSIGFRYDVLYDSNKSVYGSAWTPFIGFYF